MAMMNPFNQTDNERLYSIATGKAAYLYTEEILLTMNVRKCIERLRDIRGKNCKIENANT